ncbi:Ankyrin repeat domain-containing protein 45-like [Oopsacas minuta]|uniref:Ankyrin repeat domain-containing protein 45-like n=1 Tax=Oopsacas minuta TaxID=111878 RepID=A0AAV7KHW1_9METZ|nr:Ankyrin repeat domain-containing protein 45-like [Oopsacas minuta]
MSEELIDELVKLIEDNKLEDLSLLLTQESQDNAYVTLLKNSRYLVEPLKAACLIPGRAQFIDLLVTAGTDVTSCSTTGYTAAHMAACWGVVPAMRALVRLGANLKAKTVYGETAEDIAQRYGQEEVLKFFKFLAFQQKFRDEISYARSIVLTPENFTGKLSKEEKTRITKVCDEKNSWLEANYISANLLDVTEQRNDFKSKLNTVLEKVQPLEQV